MLRRTAQGRLSELFGERTVKIDELMRRFDLYALSVDQGFDGRAGRHGRAGLSGLRITRYWRYLGSAADAPSA